MELNKTRGIDIPAISEKLLLAIALAYSFILLFSYYDSSIAYFGDAADYISISRAPLFSMHFFSYRPFTVPLIYKMFDHNVFVIVMFQVIFHIVCWLVLAYAVSRTIRNTKLIRVAFISILLFSLSIDIIFWNMAILSESISNSLFALLLGLVLIFLSMRTGRGSSTHGKGYRLLCWIATLSAVSVLWSFSRDTNAYALLLIAAILPLFLFFREARRPENLRIIATISLLFISIYGLQAWLTSHSSRKPWIYSATDNILNRVISDKEASEYFQKRGMPISPLLLSFSGTNSEYMRNKMAFKPDPAKIDRRFDEWVKKKGMQTYLRYSLTHPIWSLSYAWSKRRHLFSSNVAHMGAGSFNLVYQNRNGRRVLIEPMCSRGNLNGQIPVTNTLTKIFFPHWPFFWWLSLLMSFVPLVLFFRKGNPVLILPAILEIVAVSQAILVAMADCVEIDRHAAALGVIVRIAFWMSVLLSLDALHTWITSREQNTVC